MLRFSFPSTVNHLFSPNGEFFSWGGVSPMYGFRITGSNLREPGITLGPGEHLRHSAEHLLCIIRIVRFLTTKTRILTTRLLNTTLISSAGELLPPNIVLNMPPPSTHRKDVEPPEEITSEAVRGFLTGAFRVRARS